ncbi:MAG: nicotinate-nucleotide adenylyltransferase [Luteimonas sp.]
MTVAAALVVLYGGTFDPVHNGHLAIARAAHQALGSVVRMMPAADPPHRPPPGASAAQRADMLDRAVAGKPGLCVDRRELERDGPSYTVLTLRELREADPDVPVALLLGADSFLGLAEWREWRALFDMVHFVVAERPGGDWRPDALPGPLAAQVRGRRVDDPAALAAAPAGRVLGLDQPLHDVSATGLRARIADGRPWRHLVPEAVAGYIGRHGLYRKSGHDAAATTSSL